MVDDTEQDDGIIELTQVVSEDSSEGTDQEVIELLDMDTQQEETREDDLGLDFDPGADKIDDSVLFDESDVASGIESSITQEQLDAALERVIEKKFSNKIEKILFEVIEKVLEKEVLDIRQRLQKDLDEIAGS
jgi:hypothetical protein